MIRRVARVSAWLLSAAIVVLSIVPAPLRPSTGAPSGWEHAGIFFLTGFAFAVGYPMGRSWKIAALISFCAMIEIMQFWAPGRHARLSDFLIDSLAVGLGFWVAHFVTRRRLAA
jgi:VanZ family protein